MSNFANIKMKRRMFLLSLITCLLQSVCCDYYLHLSSNSPVITGGTVTFKSTLKDNSNDALGTFKYEWKDNSMPSHSKMTETSSPVDFWNVTYHGFPPGPYEIQVIAYEKVLFYYRQVTSNRLMFSLTDSLNGHLEIMQDNKPILKYVSNNESVTHEILLKPSDMEYLKNLSYMALSYWFIDCQYYGVTNDFKFPFKYNVTDVQHKIEALVITGFEPVTTTTATIPSTTNNITTTTMATFKVSIQDSNARKVRQVSDNVNVLNTMSLPDEITTFSNNMLVASSKTYLFNSSFPFLCNNTTLPLSASSTYGYFSKVVTVKAPVSSVSVSGNNWLQQGNILKLNVNCKGSSIFQHCIMFYSGVYNVTGNETCLNPAEGNICEFSINRYYGTPGVHTIVVVIANDVAKLISPITVTVYKVTKQAQLSVIVVPVVFTLAAVVLVIFGVAYYIQNRTRFLVEVADFNFGPQCMEYMTFRERLRDSLVNAFTRASVNKSEGSSNRIWPPSHRYGSMT